MHIAVLIVFVLCAVFGNYISAVKDFPPYFPRCKRTDPKMQECLLKATEQVRPHIRKGIPDFLPGIEKFVIPEISMQQGTRAVNYKAYFTNVTLLGLDLYEFTRYEFVTSNLTLFIEVNLPYLYLDAQYNIDGNILFAPIKGDGHFHANITNSNCSVYHEVKIVKKNGIDYLKPTVTIPKMNVGKVEDYAFDGLFRDNEQLALIEGILRYAQLPGKVWLIKGLADRWRRAARGSKIENKFEQRRYRRTGYRVVLTQATNRVIKENLYVIIEEFTPAVEKVLAAIFDDVIFKSVTQIPYDKIYPK